MFKKYIALSIVLFPVILVLVLVGLTISAGVNENRLIEFCNSLKLGQTHKEIFSRVEILKGSEVNSFSDYENSPQLISKGIYYATCNMEFKDKVLIEKQIGIS